MPLRPQMQLLARCHHAWALLALLACWGAAYAESPDYSEVRSGTLFLHTAQNAGDAVLLHSKVRMHIAGIVADVQLSQEFANNATTWSEGVYVFPLPENASVRAMTIHVGERLIEGRILPREEADQTYQRAAQNGQVAGLVRQERANLFSTRIANIAPGARIRVELDYFQTLDIADDAVSLRVPSTITPRYDPNHAEAYRLEVPTPTAETLSSGHRSREEAETQQMDLEVAIDGARPIDHITSPSHPIQVVEAADQYLVTPQQHTVAMDRDFVLRWHYTPSPTPAPTLYVQQTDQGRYGLLMIHPPSDNAEQPPPPAREVIFVLDTSGSMAGNSMRAAKAALARALDQLEPDAYFNIIRFNNSARRLFQASRPATRRHLSFAKNYIAQLHGDGGTEMLDAVALATADPMAQYMRQIVFITDGSVANETEVFQRLRQTLGTARFFTVGIGKAPNTYFMRKAAEVGRGSYRYIERAEQVESGILNLLSEMSAPVLTDIAIHDDTQTLTHFPDPIPDVYAGKALITSLALPAEATTLTVNGNYQGTPWQTALDISTPVSDAEGIASLWARSNIEHLMDAQWLLDDDTLHKDAIIDLSTRYGVLSQWTSFLAVDTTPVRPPHTELQQRKVPNLIPAGSMQAVPMPQGATGANLWLVCAAALLLLLLLFLLLEIASRRARSLP